MLQALGMFMVGVIICYVYMYVCQKHTYITHQLDEVPAVRLPPGARGNS